MEVNVFYSDLTTNINCENPIISWTHIISLTAT